MADPKLIREWLQKADEDLGFAASIIEDSPFYAQICFHLQQAAEKYLKAVIVAEDLEFQKIHDLVALLKSCLSRRPELISLMPQCKLLNRYAEPLLHRHTVPGPLAHRLYEGKSFSGAGSRRDDSRSCQSVSGRGLIDRNQALIP